MLCCIVLCCVVLCCVVLNCAVLCCAVLSFVVLCCDGGLSFHLSGNLTEEKGGKSPNPGVSVGYLRWCKHCNTPINSYE